MRTILSRTPRAARVAAPPPMTAWREAKAPRPNGVASVSPSTTVTASKATPSSEATIWATVVSVPCPCDVTPASTVTAPDGSIRTVAPSWPVRKGMRGPAEAACPRPVSSL